MGTKRFLFGSLLSVKMMASLCGNLTGVECGHVISVRLGILHVTRFVVGRWAGVVLSDVLGVNSACSL
jgi:hypothetical protein